MKARASINPYRDEVYTEIQAAIEEKLKDFHAQQGQVDPALNTTPVELKKKRNMRRIMRRWKLVGNKP